MGFFGKKERDVEQLITQHIELVDQAVRQLDGLFKSYFGDSKDYKKISKQVHNLEHEADVVRRKIELKLYEGAFLAMFREDFISLSEGIDKVAGKAEALADSLTLERPIFPQEYHDDFLALLQGSVEAFNPFLNIGDLLDSDLDRFLKIAARIEEAEQLVDRAEWKLLERIFNSDLELAHKLQLRDFVRRAAAISDLCEDASDMLEILVVKRRI